MSQETEIERRVRAAMEKDFDARVRAIVRCEMQPILKEVTEDINSGLDIKVVQESLTLKQALFLQEDVAQQKLYFENKINDLVKDHEAAVNESKSDVVKMKTECQRRADVADNEYKLLKQSHSDFTASNAEVQKTQYELMATVSSFLSLAALGGLCYYFFK